MTTCSRRTFLAGTMATGAVLAAHTVLQSQPALAAQKSAPLSLEEIVSLSPAQMAERSPLVQAAWQYLQDACSVIGNGSVRETVRSILANPAPLLARGDEKAILAELRAQGLTDRDSVFPPCGNAAQSPQPFITAPGSGWKSHHCYPGGLVTHTALNVASCRALYDSYASCFELRLDRDVVVASQILHDLHKPWVFMWDKNGVCRTEQQLAGTGEHHILSIAESMRRGLPAEMVVAQACAHDHPGTDKSEASVVNWIRAAAIINGIDPVKGGYLAADGRTLPLPRRMEGFVTHLADHDFVLSGPACQWTVAALKPIAARLGISEADMEKKPFAQLRNYVLSQKTAMQLYGAYAAKGADGLQALVAEVVKA